ncbi:MAG: hypothetical protein JST06_09215 [Bacteroidetes bacterium]|nr:hypothetical protein [Bacteroidota bacterium]
MPSKTAVQAALLEALYRHNGTIKEFASSEGIVAELAAIFHLSAVHGLPSLRRSIERRID